MGGQLEFMKYMQGKSSGNLGNAGGGLTYAGSDDDDRGFGDLSETINSSPQVDEEMDEIGAASPEAEEAKRGKDALNTTVAVAAQTLAKEDQTPQPIVNIYRQKVDANPNKQPKYLGDLGNDLLRKYQDISNLDTAALAANLDSDKRDQTETEKLLREKINELDKRKTDVDLTPLLAFVPDTDRAKFLAELLASGESFTAQKKKQQINELKLLLAQHTDKNNDNYKKIFSKALADNKKAALAGVEAEMKLNADQSKAFVDQLDKFDNDKEVVKHREIIASSYGLTESFKDERAFRNVVRDEKGKIISAEVSPAFIAQAKALRAKALAGGGTMSDTDVAMFSGGDPSFYQRVLRMIGTLKDGQALTAEDLQDFVKAAQVQALSSERRLFDISKGFKQKSRTIGIPEDIANDQWDSYLSDNFGRSLLSIQEKPSTLFGIPKKTILGQGKDAADKAKEEASKAEKEYEEWKKANGIKD